MKKLLINAVLLAVSAFIAYLLIDSIRIPIDFEKTLTAREQAVRNRLLEIGELQKMYKSLHEVYAPSFDSLYTALMNDTFIVERIIGDPNDTTKTVERSLVHLPAKDSLLNFMKKSITIPEATDLQAYFAQLKLVPFSDAVSGKPVEFEMEASEIMVGSGVIGGDPVTTPTFEVRTKLATFMPEFDESYNKFNTKYIPENYRKIGDLTKPINTGNW